MRSFLCSAELSKLLVEAVLHLFILFVTFFFFHCHECQQFLAFPTSLSLCCLRRQHCRFLECTSDNLFILTFPSSSSPPYPFCHLLSPTSPLLLKSNSVALIFSPLFYLSSSFFSLIWLSTSPHPLFFLTFLPFTGLSTSLGPGTKASYSSPRTAPPYNPKRLFPQHSADTQANAYVRARTHTHLLVY